METADNIGPPQLMRGLGTSASAAVIIGSMIGQSIFLIPSQVARDVGSPALVLAAWLIGGAIVLFATFCYAELGATLPHAGGEYVYLRRGLGPKWGFLFGWTSAVLQGPAMAAAISTGLMRFVAYFLPSVSEPVFAANIPHPFGAEPYRFTLTVGQALAAAAIVMVAGLNYVGVRTAGRAQIMMTALKVAGIAIIVGLGITMTYTDSIDNLGASAIPLSRPSGLLTALVPVMLAYNGFQTLSQIGGEIGKPGKTLPRAAIFGVLTVVLVYLLINLVYIRVLGVSRVASSQHVASDVALTIAGPAGARWLTTIMMLSAIGSLHANFLGRSRIPYAMARDGLFFAFGRRIQPTYHTPSGALIFHGAVSVVLVLTGTYEEIYSLGIFSIWIFVALTAIALMRLRKTEPSPSRPYRARGYPWTPLAVTVAASVISANLWLLRPVRSSIGLAVILIGLASSGHWRKREAAYLCVGSSQQLGSSEYGLLQAKHRSKSSSISE